jgi:tetratricopeptide (TPR) repeat protein
MTDSELGAWLRQQREARGWAKAEMARRLVQAGRDNDDAAVPGVSGMLHNIHRWEREGGVSERHKLHYCRALGIAPAQFGPRPEGYPDPGVTPDSAAAMAVPAAAAVLVPVQAGDGIPGLPGSHLPTPAAIAYRGRQEHGLGHFAVEQEVVMAAHDSSDHAAEHEQHGVGDATLEQLRADLVRLSSLSDTGAPLSAFLDMRRVRDRIYRLLDRWLWPREQADLYFLLGCVHELMGLAANRLGYPDAAEELIRAGWAYANAIDHNPLRGMLRARLSYVMYWRGWYAQSRDLAADGLRYASQGLVGANLHLEHARALAYLGDSEAARREVALAHAAREADYSDDLAEIGGEEFALSRAATYSMAGGALAGVGDAREAAGELETAINLYDAGPGPGEQHGVAGKALAGADLAMVRVRSGALDGAVVALEPVLALPPAQRVFTLTARLTRVRGELVAPVFRGSPQARDLGDQIEEFGREAVTAGLRSLSGPS